MCYSALSPGGSLATSARIGEVKQSVQKPFWSPYRRSPCTSTGCMQGAAGDRRFRLKSSYRHLMPCALPGQMA